MLRPVYFYCLLLCLTLGTPIAELYAQEVRLTPPTQSSSDSPEPVLETEAIAPPPVEAKVTLSQETPPTVKKQTIENGAHQPRLFKHRQRAQPSPPLPQMMPNQGEGPSMSDPMTDSKPPLITQP